LFAHLSTVNTLTSTSCTLLSTAGRVALLLLLLLLLLMMMNMMMMMMMQGSQVITLTQWLRKQHNAVTTACCRLPD
jgi:hypothetical protein